MSAGRRPPAVDLLSDDLLQAIFLRLPPEPSHLLAASLVCKRWCGLTRNLDFLQRFRSFHRTPPVLGFFQNIWLPTCPSTRRIRFFPTAAPAARLSPPNDFPYGMPWVMDCRHGRVLIYNDAVRELLVWDPVIGRTDYVRVLEELRGEDFTGAVVCAAGHDDHAHCHSSPFQIIFLDNSVDDECLVSACVYSSETHVWSDWVSITTPAFVSNDSSALIGNSLCWTLNFAANSHILEFELHSQILNLIQLPESVRKHYRSKIHVMPAENGGIGFTGVKESRIDFWSRITDHEGVAGWTLVRIVDMGKLTLSSVPVGNTLVWSTIVGFVENNDVLFLNSKAGIFMIDLKSMQLKKMPQASASTVYPYTSFYTRGDDIIGIDVRHQVPKEEEEAAAGSC